jgi:uncharacterized membrane protein YtjA (UPF0391 family)
MGSRVVLALRAHAQKDNVMLRYSLVFFIVAIIAAVLGFGGIASGAVGIAKLLFWVFLLLTIISAAFRLTDRASV